MRDRLVETSSTDDIHNGLVDEGSPSTTSKAVVEEDYAGRDQASIVEFCRYAMGIYEF